jgi:hypothetical protein
MLHNFVYKINKCMEHFNHAARISVAGQETKKPIEKGPSHISRTTNQYNTKLGGNWKEATGEMHGTDLVGHHQVNEIFKTVTRIFP